MFITSDNLRGLALGPTYTKLGPGGRIVPKSFAVAEEKAGRPASGFSGDINPSPRHSVMEDNMRGMGAIERFARVPKWGGDIVDLDRRPLVETGASLEGVVDKIKAYALPIGLGLGAAVVLAFVMKGRRKRRNPRRRRYMRRRRR